MAAVTTTLLAALALPAAASRPAGANPPSPAGGPLADGPAVPVAAAPATESTPPAATGSSPRTASSAATTWVSATDFRKVYDPGVVGGRQWYINDHTFVRGPDGTWHLFGITGMEGDPAENETTFAHATAPSPTGPWTRQPAVLRVDPGYFGEQHLWAPHVVQSDGVYYMFYAAGSGADAAINLATSTDLWHWTRLPTGPLFRDGFEARDPMLTRIGDQWVMYYDATSAPEGGNCVVAYRTSRDLLHWGPKRIAFTDPMVTTVAGVTESPFVVEHGGSWYLFIGPRGGYAGTDVYRSSDPLHFDQSDFAGHFAAHAAEVVQDGGSWWASAAGWYQKGVALSRLQWVDFNGVTEAIQAKYRELGGAAGPLGATTAREYDVPGGRETDFAGGAIVWSPAAGAHAVYGEILAKYWALGGPGGALGAPTSDEYAVRGGRESDFAGGTVLWSAPAGAHAVYGEILAKYRTLGGPGGPLGLPSSDERGPSWRASDFVGGSLYWSPATGIHQVHGAILAEYRTLGESGAPIGLPTSEEYALPGGRASSFTGGNLYWSPQTGAREVRGAILGRYLALGGPDSWVGFPTSNERGVPGGRASSFTGANLYWGPTVGVHEVHGAIRGLYVGLGEAAELGLPTSDELPAAAPWVRRNAFTKGTIAWSPTAGAVRR